jgi:hypothetical protein
MFLGEAWRRSSRFLIRRLNSDSDRRTETVSDILVPVVFDGSSVAVHTAR